MDDTSSLWPIAALAFVVMFVGVVAGVAYFAYLGKLVVGTIGERRNAKP